MTQASILEKYLQSLNGNWIERNQLSNLHCEFGFMPPRIERTARRMIEENEKAKREGRELPYLIEVKYEKKNNKKIAWVRALVSKIQPKFRVEEINKETVKLVMI